MSPNDAQDHFDRLAADITTSVPPRLLDAARTTRRRHRRARVATAAAVLTVLVVAGASVPPGWWVRDATPSVTSPGRTGLPESRLVLDRGDVLGEWTATEVGGAPVPLRALRGLSITSTGATGLSLTYGDGVNGHTRETAIRPDGGLRRAGQVSTLVGCAGPYDECARPSGFGVADAVALRLTPGGSLVLVGPGETALALYDRAR